MLLRSLAFCSAFALAAAPAAAEPPASSRVDHILLGVPDLDQAVAELAKVFGVTPVHGGKHPRGTHNALLSLGPGVYLELIALQPGVKGAEVGMADLDKLARPQLIGWAVSSPDLAALRARLAPGGFTLSAPQAGSRTTPKGEVLRWQAAGLEDGPAGAPFFLAWSADTAHPAATSPGGCSLTTLEVATPAAARLRALCATLDLPVRVTEAPAVSYVLKLACPAGPVTFGSGAPAS